MLSRPASTAAGAGPTVESGPAPFYRWVAVGLLERDEQMAILVDRLDELSDGGRLVLISGEAGDGKTALD